MYFNFLSKLYVKFEVSSVWIRSANKRNGIFNEKVDKSNSGVVVTVHATNHCSYRCAIAQYMDF